MCAVEGAIDTASCARLGEALEVALGLEPGASVTLDLTQVDWMALPGVRAVIDSSRRAHPDCRIVAMLPGQDHEDRPVVPAEADESQTASAVSRGDQDFYTSTSTSAVG